MIDTIPVDGLEVEFAYERLLSERFKSLPAAHLYESCFGDIETAEALANAYSRIGQMASAGLEDPATWTKLGAPMASPVDFVAFVIKESSRLKETNELAARIHREIDCVLRNYRADSSMRTVARTDII